MTAQTFTGSRAAANVPVFKADGSGIVQAAYGSYTLAEVPEVGDVYRLCRLPAGAVPIGGYFAATDIDSGTETLDIDLGIEANGVETADPDYFTNSGVLTGDAITDFAFTQAANVRMITRTSFAALTNETIVSATVVAIHNSGGTGTVSCVIYYVVP